MIIRRFLPTTLKAQLVVYGAIAALVAAAVTTFINFRFAEVGARREVRAHMFEVAAALQSVLAQADPQASQEILEAFDEASGAPEGHEVLMVDPYGLVVASSRRESVGKPVEQVMGFPEQEMSKILAGRLSEGLKETTHQGISAFELTLPLYGDPANPGRVTRTLHYVEPFTSYRALVQRALVQYLASGLLLALLLITPLWLFLKRSILTPLRHTALANRAVTESRDEETTIPESLMPSHEIGDIMRSRNEMLARLEAAQKELRQLYESERSQRQLAETLSQTSQTLSASLDLNKVLHTLLEQLGQVLVVDAGLILLREGDHLRVAAVRGRPELRIDRLLGYRLPVSANKDFWRVIQEKRVLTFCQPGRQPPFTGGFHPIEEVDWCLVVPLLCGDKVIGLLALEQLDHCYDEKEEPQIAMAFANHAVVAIENARLYAEVKALNEELEARVEQRTRELNQAREALARQADQLRQLLNKTISIQEEERDRVAQDIHDGVSQLIMGALYETQAANVSLSKRPEVAQEKLQNAQQILKQVKTEMRRIIYDLHPATLSDSGLVPALEAYVADFQTHTGIGCTLATLGSTRRLAPERERAVYRVVQEALHNVAQHAQADQAEVTLAFIPEGLRVSVEDNGCGFDHRDVQDASPGHLGLVSMQERAQSVGGELQIHSQPGSGTRIIVHVPVDEHPGGEENGEDTDTCR